MPSSTMPVKSEAGLASVLRISVMRLSRRLRNQRADDHQLTANQLGVMSTVNRHGALTIGEIAALEKVRPPSTTRTVSSLEALGLAVREPHPTDGRQVVVRLADEGRRILAADRKRRDAWLARRLHELSPEEREILRQAAPILERLAAA